MEITLDIDDSLVARLEEEATRLECTISELVELALRRMLGDRPVVGRPPALPTWSSGGACVNMADGDELYQAMEGR